MAEKIEPRGLCATCRNADGCAYLQQAGAPVLQCEEFDGYQPPRRRAGGPGARSARPPVGPDASEDDASHYKGLCVDCEDRRTCTFPRPEGGVWRCEEYR
jgi:hypothetical protein